MAGAKIKLSSLALAFSFLLVACGSFDDAGTQVDRVSEASSTEPVEVVAPEVDAANAGSIDEVFSSTDTADHEIAAGDWSAVSFSEPIAFHLSQPGRVLFQTNGILVIESGPTDEPDGRIAIIEAVAFNTPEGPAPLGSAPLGSEFPDATILNRQLLTSQDRLLSSVDLRFDSATTPDSNQFDCGHPQFNCTRVLLTETEGDSPAALLNTQIRYVGQDFGARRLYVAAIAEDPIDSRTFGERATEVAVSIVPAEGDFLGRRLFSTLDQRGEPVPAGTWFAPIAGAVAEVRSDVELEEVTFDFSDPVVIVFTTTEPDPYAGFFMFEFSGFVDGVDMRIPTRDAPLSAEEFIDGMNQATGVTDVVESVIAGQDAVTWEFAPLDPDSPLACSAVERDDLGPEELCTNWGAEGARRVQFLNEPVLDGQHYIPELGIVVAWSFTDTGNGNPFDEIIDALTLTEE